LTTERVNLATLVEPYVGKYYSNDYVRRNILRQTDAEILEQDALIEAEIESGQIPDPNAMPVDPMTGQPMPPEPGGEPNAINGGMGAVPTTPEAAPPKGGEI